MNFLLEFTKDQFAQEKLPLNISVPSGLEVVLTGLLTVFSVLIILWLALFVFKIFFHDLHSRQKTPKNTDDETLPVSPTPESANNEEIIAVIAAAIAMAESECGSAKQFRVVAFKRK